METKKQQIVKSSIGISAENTQAVVYALSKILADEYILALKTRNAHWNIEFANFYALHTFFDSQYKQLDILIDKIAERIRSLGHYSPATMKLFLELSSLTEMHGEISAGSDFIRALIADHESIIFKMREQIDPFLEKNKDAATSNFITGLIEEHEIMAWLLRSHL